MEFIWLILFAASTLAFILDLGVYAVPEKKKFVPIWLRVTVLLLFFIPIILEVYLTYFTTIPLSFRYGSGRLLRSALNKAVINTSPYNIISFTAAGLNVVFGYMLHRILWKHRTEK